MNNDKSTDIQGELPEISEEDKQWLHYNPNTSDLVEWIQDYARKAIAAAPKDPTDADTIIMLRNEIEDLKHDNVQLLKIASDEAALSALPADRHELQKEGKHPAPCARFCEATAFNIEIRSLKSQLAASLAVPAAEQKDKTDSVQEALKAVRSYLQSVAREHGNSLANMNAIDRVNYVLTHMDKPLAEPLVQTGECKSVPAFPERDQSKPAEQQGMFRKFEVRRADGSDAPGGKHHGCRYFVFDLDHDPHAPAGMTAYALDCAETHPQLSAELLAEFPVSSFDTWDAAFNAEIVRVSQLEYNSNEICRHFYAELRKRVKAASPSNEGTASLEADAAEPKLSLDALEMLKNEGDDSEDLHALIRDLQTSLELMIYWAREVSDEAIDGAEERAEYAEDIRLAIAASKAALNLESTRQDRRPNEKNGVVESPLLKQEAVAEYQYRSRPMWTEGKGWSEWERCSAGVYEDYLKVPELHDWQYEVRALYAHPKGQEQ